MQEYLKTSHPNDWVVGDENNIQTMGSNSCTCREIDLRNIEGLRRSVVTCGCQPNISRIKVAQSKSEEISALRQFHQVYATYICPSHLSQANELQFIPMIRKIYPETATNIENYTILNKISSGLYGHTSVCISEDGKQYVLKTFKKENILSFEVYKSINSEIQSLSILNSEYIVRLHKVIHSPSAIYLFMEKGSEDLFEFISRHRFGLREKWVVQIVQHILMAVKVCHDANVSHRDLKPENILINFDETTERVVELKLCDFGQSVIVTDQTHFRGVCGSPGFLAPEVVYGTSYDPKAVDLWSVGCITLELTLGKKDFHNHWLRYYDDIVFRDPYRFVAVITNGITEIRNSIQSIAIRKFIEHILCINSISRNSVANFLGMSIFHSQSKVQSNPNHRRGIHSVRLRPLSTILSSGISISDEISPRLPSVSVGFALKLHEDQNDSPRNSEFEFRQQHHSDITPRYYLDEVQNRVADALRVCQTSNESSMEDYLDSNESPTKLERSQYYITLVRQAIDRLSDI